MSTLAIRAKMSGIGSDASTPPPYLTIASAAATYATIAALAAEATARANGDTAEATARANADAAEAVTRAAGDVAALAYTDTRETAILAAVAGTYLTIANAASTYLPLAGGTLTGNLQIRATTEKTFIGATGGFPGIWFGNVTPTTANFAFLYDAASGPLINAATGLKVFFQVNNSTVAQISADGIAIAGNLASPGPRLYVKGNTDSNSYARIDSASGNVQAIVGTSDTVAFVGSLSAHDFEFRRNNLSKLKVFSAAVHTADNLIVRGLSGTANEKVEIGHTGGYPGIWFAGVSPSTSNYGFLYDYVNSVVCLNSPGYVVLRNGNVDIASIRNSRFHFSTPNSAPTDSHLTANGWTSFFLDDAAGTLNARVKNASGVLSTFRIGRDVWTQNTRPLVADSRDDEFEGTLSAWTAIGTADTVNAVNAYTNFAAGGMRRSINVLRPSWLLMQAPADGAYYGFSKSLGGALAADTFVILRGAVSHRNSTVSNNDGTLALVLAADSAGAIDLNNCVRCWISETDASLLGAQSDRMNAGVVTVIREAGNEQSSGLDVQAVAMQYIHSTTTVHFWCLTTSGGWMYMGSYVLSGFTLAHVGIIHSNAVTTAPGCMVVGVDYVRFVAGSVTP